MDDDNGTVAVKQEDSAGGDSRVPDGKPSYKSWKKKYRKMRITFDHKMHDGEELFAKELKGYQTCNRLAVEIE